MLSIENFRFRAIEKYMIKFKINTEFGRNRPRNRSRKLKEYHVLVVNVVSTHPANFLLTDILMWRRANKDPAIETLTLSGKIYWRIIYKNLHNDHADVSTFSKYLHKYAFVERCRSQRTAPVSPGCQPNETIEFKWPVRVLRGWERNAG